jgi:RNA-splicing ligase RtcB
MIQAYNVKPDFAIIEDVYAGQWIKDYSLANCKMMLGQAREKFAQIAGPQGGSSLNGAAMKAEAQAEIEKLTDDLIKNVPGGSGYTWIIG